MECGFVCCENCGLREQSNCKYAKPYLLTVDEEDGFSYVGLGDLRRLRMSLYMESDRFLTLSVGPISVMDATSAANITGHAMSTFNKRTTFRVY